MDSLRDAPLVDRLSRSQVVEEIIERKRIVIPFVSVVLMILLWDAYARGQPPYLFPTTAGIVEAFQLQIAEDDLIGAFGKSLQAFALGYTLAIIGGIFVGLLMGLSDRIDKMLDPYVSAFYVAPTAALIPIIILLLGITFEARTFVVFMICVFEIIVDTSKGVKTTPSGPLDVARSFGAGRLFRIRHVVLPHSLPFIFAGLRLTIGRGVKAMILVELLISFVNLGLIIREWQASFRIAGILSVVILLMVFALVLTFLIQVAERRVITWRADAEVGA